MYKNLTWVEEGAGKGYGQTLWDDVRFPYMLDRAQVLQEVVSSYVPMSGKKQWVFFSRNCPFLWTQG